MAADPLCSRHELRASAVPPALHHVDCGEPVTIVARCSAGHDLASDDIAVSAPGPFGLDDPHDP